MDAETARQPSWRFHPDSGADLAFEAADDAVRDVGSPTWREAWEQERTRLEALAPLKEDWMLRALLFGLGERHLAGRAPVTRAEIEEASPGLLRNRRSTRTLNEKLRELMEAINRDSGARDGEFRMMLVVAAADYRLVAGRPSMKARPTFHYLLALRREGSSASKAGVHGDEAHPERRAADLLPEHESTEEVVPPAGGQAATAANAPSPSTDPPPVPMTPGRATTRSRIVGGVGVLAVLVAVAAWATSTRTAAIELREGPTAGVALVQGLGADGTKLWGSLVDGRSDGLVARWPPDGARAADYLAVATPALGPALPGTVRLYDVRRRAWGEPRNREDRLVGGSFLQTPEPGAVGTPSGYGFFGVGFFDGGLVALAHDHLMAPSWVLAYDFEGRRQGRVFHPGHLDRLAIVARDGASYALAAGVNNRLCLAGAAASVDCPSTPVVIEIPLPFRDGQLPPGCGSDLPLALGRMWRVTTQGFRFHEVEPVTDGSGSVYLHGEDETQGDCWAIWYLDPGGAMRASSVAPGCSDPPLIAPVPMKADSALCGRLVEKR